MSKLYTVFFNIHENLQLSLFLMKEKVNNFKRNKFLHVTCIYPF